MEGIANPDSIRDNATVTDNATIGGKVLLHDNAAVSGYAVIDGNARVYDHARVYEYAVVVDNAHLYRNARVYGNAFVGGRTVLTDDAAVYGYAELYRGRLGQHADVFLTDHVIVIHGMFPDMVTVYRARGGARVQAGCQNFPLSDSIGTLKTLADEHGWSLPEGWVKLVDALRERAASWDNTRFAD